MEQRVHPSASWSQTHSWQIVPTALPRLIGGPDPAGAQRALQAMFQMRKIDIAALQRAYDGA